MAQDAYAANAKRVEVTIELKRPLIDHGKTVNTIELREVTLGDWQACGPITRRFLCKDDNAESPKVELVEDRDALVRWVMRLSGLSQAVVVQMTAPDGPAVAREVNRLVAEFEAGNG